MKPITLGIGPGENIAGVVMVGLYVNPIFTGLRATEIKRDYTGLDLDNRLQDGIADRTIAALDVDSRPAMYQSSAVGLESGEGAWLFEDGTRMVWDTLTGNEGTIKRDVSGLVQ